MIILFNKIYVKEIEKVGKKNYIDILLVLFVNCNGFYNII